MMLPERFFISFSPGFNRVISGLSDFPKPFQRFTFPSSQSETVETVRRSKGNLNHPVETG
jgi:hypothetical protein